MKTFLVQKIIEGKLVNKIYNETEIINFLSMNDCYDFEYKMYDISVFGQINEVFEGDWQPDCFITVRDKEGKVIVSGYGVEH